jgi:hypothetical protein
MLPIGQLRKTFMIVRFLLLVLRKRLKQKEIKTCDKKRVKNGGNEEVKKEAEVKVEKVVKEKAKKEVKEKVKKEIKVKIPKEAKIKGITINLYDKEADLPEIPSSPPSLKYVCHIIFVL